MPRNFRKARTPVRAHEVTDNMLAAVRKAADQSWLPQTVWPSYLIGRNYVGHICLVTSKAAPTDEAPWDAYEGSEPLLTVLPSNYLGSMVQAKKAHTEGTCYWAMCPFESLTTVGA